MMAFCERLSEQLAIVATIDPIAVTGVTTVSDVFSMALHRRALFILQTGAVFGQATVLIQEGPVVGMTGSTTILTGAVTAITAVASQYLFEVSGEAMAAGMSFLRASLAGITPTDVISMVVLADVERYHPGSDNDLGTVVIAGVAN
jgi:hypothetical protein